MKLYTFALKRKITIFAIEMLNHNIMDNVELQKRTDEYWDNR